MGENIGMDNADVYTIYKGFEEADEDYDGQGHRRNMLNPAFQYVGYARIYVSGMFYTVQIFSSHSTGVTAKTAGNEYITQNVEVESGGISSFSPVVSIDSKYVDRDTNTWTIGINNESVKLDTTKVWLYTSFTGDPNDEPNGATLIPSDTTVTFENNSLIEIDSNGYLRPKKSGTTTMTVNYKAINETYTVTLKVEAALDFANTQYVLEKNENGISGTYYFTGKPITPKLSFCRVGNSFPVEGIDYVLEYENNVDVGWATLKIKGIGSHTGVKTTRFYIGLKNDSTPGTVVSPGNTTSTETNQEIGSIGNTTGGNKKKEVTFHANGGSCATKSLSYAVGSQLSTLPKATRTGYSFKGWYTKKSGGTKVESTTKVNGTMTLYAQWSKVKVGKASISSLSVGKKKATVKVKKVSGAKGYQIRYAEKKNMKGSKTLTATSLKKTISKLKKGKRYYFQVRAYKKDSTGAKVYGSWSTKKQCKKVK